ncbi:ABC transporter permease [Streptomyces sp. NRRL B-24484]|uniref:ABC transporter permease n=1 Tax=Streptomyces sp. NRRL B-24484 TaxID=1463833 RepID=UPI0004C187E1|nr:ABC transporter permease [Streptomyces sp. NRRL B-24484]
MGRYVIRRLLQMIPVFLGSTFLIFVMVHALGDPVNALFGDRAPDPVVAQQIREQYNLNDPLWLQYLIYMSNLFRWDFGTTFNGQSVTSLLATAYPATIKLTAVAFTIEVIFGIGFGLISGLRRGGWSDNTVLIFTLIVISIPTFVTGYVLQYLVGVQWGILPATAGEDLSLQSLLLPGIVLASVSLAYVARLTRTTVAENSRADFVRTAVAKGLPRRRVTINHLLRNSLIPVVTFLGADLGALMGGALVTERIFNIHGVGFYLYQGIVRQNTATVVGFVTVLIIIYLAANLLVDLLYAVLDPRIRYA